MGGVAEGGAGLAWTGAEAVEFWGADTGAELDMGGCDNMARRACNVKIDVTNICDVMMIVTCSRASSSSFSFRRSCSIFCLSLSFLSIAFLLISCCSLSVLSLG